MGRKQSSEALERLRLAAFSKMKIEPSKSAGDVEVLRPMASGGWNDSTRLCIPNWSMYLTICTATGLGNLIEYQLCILLLYKLCFTRFWYYSPLLRVSTTGVRRHPRSRTLRTFSITSNSILRCHMSGPAEQKRP